MKKLTWIWVPILVILSSNVAICQSMVWTAEQKFVRNSKGNDRPRIIKLDEDHGIMIWGAEGDQSIWYSTWEKEVFSSPTKLNIGSSKAFIFDWASTEIGGKDQNVYIVFKADPADTASIFLVSSFDYGKSFGPAKPIVDGKVLRCRFPGVVADASGNPIVSYMLFRSGWEEATYVSMHSTDLGKTFEPMRFVSDTLTGDACDCCPVAMRSEGDKVAVIFRNNRNNIRNMEAVVSYDNGDSYVLRKELDTANWVLNSCPASGGDCYFEGLRLHTVWMSGRSGVSKVYYSELNLQTNKIDRLLRLDHFLGAGQLQNYPRITGKEDTIGIVWQEYNRNTEIFMTWANTKSTKDLTKNVMLVPTNSTGNQINPDIIYQNGQWMVIWQDNLDNSVKWRFGRLMNVTNTEELEKSTTQIRYRNKTLFINAKEKVTELFVYTVSGQKILQLKNPQDQIHFDHVKQMYFFNAVLEDGRVISEKLLND